MLKHLLDISTGFRYKKMEKNSPSIYRDVHDLAYYWLHSFITVITWALHGNKASFYESRKRLGSRKTWVLVVIFGIHIYCLPTQI